MCVKLKWWSLIYKGELDKEHDVNKNQEANYWEKTD